MTQAVLLSSGIAPINKWRPDDLYGGVTFDQTACGWLATRRFSWSWRSDSTARCARRLPCATCGAPVVRIPNSKFPIP